jgi:protein disulfide-isomerase-like protein
LKQQMGCDAVNCGVLVKNNVKYRMSDNGFTEVTAETVAAFLALEASGSVKSFTKTQEVPAEREEENVVTLVGKNFESEVSKTNTFVFFYAPWCGHCKNAKPDYQKLKETLNRPDIVVAQFDATENDIPHDGCKVEGFPTFYLFKAGQYSTPLLYNGGRTLDAWVSFLNEQVPATVSGETKTDL